MPIPTDTVTLRLLLFVLLTTYLSSYASLAGTTPADPSETSQRNAIPSSLDECSIPQNLHLGVGTSTTEPIGWNTVVGSMIRYRVRWRQIGTQEWTERPITPNPFDNITGLTNATTYEAQAQTICNGQPTAYSGSITFTTSCHAPEGGYAYDVTLTTALLSWGGFGEGSTYQLRWRVAGSTDWPNNLTLSGVSYQFTGLSSRVTYEYQLRTNCPDGNQSDYFPVRSFTTTDCLPPTALQEYDPVESRIQLAWSVNYDQQVDLRWRPTGAPDWTLVTNLPTSNPTQDNGQATGFYSLTGLTNNTAYEWGVQTICNANSRSSFTQLRTFTATCGMPGYLGELQIQPTSAQVYWRAVDGITYRLQWRPKNMADTTWRTQPDQTMRGNALMVVQLTNLTPGTFYEWRVMTRCSAGSNSDFTTPRAFQTACGPPINLQQVFVTSTTARVQWNPLSPTTRYRVRWRRYEGSAWTEGDLTDNAYYDIAGLQTTSRYVFQVQAVCGGTAGNYSGDASFITYCNIPVYPYTNDIGATSAQVGWGAFDGVSSYEVQWRTGGTTTWPLSATSTGVGTYTLTSLTPATTYEWRVRLLCTDGNISEFTDSRSFTTTTCSVVNSLRDGDWTDPAMWSCQRIPTAFDSVDVRHVVYVQRGVIASVRSLRYSAGGRLVLGSQVKLKIGM